jgi:hypothetical protein
MSLVSDVVQNAAPSSIIEEAVCMFVMDASDGDYYNIEEEMKLYPDIYRLFKSLPPEFQFTARTGPSHMTFFLPRTERLVEYMLSEDFESIMLELYRLSSHVVMTKHDRDRINWNKVMSERLLPSAD